MTIRPFPIEKYHFYQAGNRIIAVSTYCKKPVRGVAICDPSDNFNIETGKRLAAARCNEKVAFKRLNRATEKYAEALAAFNHAKDHLERMREYYVDAELAYQQAGKETDNTYNEIVNH